MTATDPGQSVSRVRALLSSYYGLAGATTAVAREVDVMDINKPEFSAERYTERLLAEHTVDGLIAEARKTKGDIKRLDSEMQSLVYENYNKFISASDIIRQMKVKVDSLDTEMQVLARKTDGVMSHADELSAKLSDNRVAMQRLSNASEFFEKISFLLQLPGQMRAHLDLAGESGMDEVARLHVKYGRTLERLAALLDIHAVLDECRAHVAHVRTALEARVVAPGRSRAQVHNDMRLLSALGVDLSTMQESYMAQQTAALARTLELAIGEADKAAKTQHPSGGVGKGIDSAAEADALARHPVSVLTRRFVPAVAEWARNFSLLFLHADTAKANEAGASVLDARGAEVMTPFFTAVRAEFAAPCASATALVEGLDSLAWGVGQVEAQLPGVSFKKRVSAITTHAMLAFVGNTFANAREHVHAELAAMGARTKELAAPGGGGGGGDGGGAGSHATKLSAVVDRAADTVRSTLADALAAVEPLAAHARADDRDMLATEVHVKVQQVLFSLSDAMTTHLSAHEKARDPRAGAGSFVLCLARMGVRLSSEIVGSYVATVRRAFAAPELTVLADESVFTTDLAKATSALLALYVDMHGQSLAAAVGKTFGAVDWARLPQRDGDRAAMHFDRLVNGIALVKSEAEALCPAPARDARAHAGGHRRVPSGASAAAAAASTAPPRTNSSFDFTRMEEAAQSQTKVAFTAAALVGSVLEHVLRALLEHLRAAVFSAGGAVIMRANIESLRVELVAMSEGDKLTVSLIDELVRSLRDRSLVAA